MKHALVTARFWLCNSSATQTPTDIPGEEIANKLREAVANDHKVFQQQPLKIQQQKNITEQQKPSQQKRKGNRPKL